MMLAPVSQVPIHRVTIYRIKVKLLIIKQQIWRLAFFGKHSRIDGTIYEFFCIYNLTRRHAYFIIL